MDKFIITIDCQAEFWDDIYDFIGVLQNTHAWERLLKDYNITVDNIFINRDNY